MRYVEVILKIAERCNLNCDYCYVFNRGNELWQKDPALIGDETVESLARFLEQGVRDCAVQRLRIDLHGGEPLLLPKARLVALCESISTRLEGLCEYEFALQTNGVLIDDKWIEIFERFAIAVSVSLDGPKAFNDLHRLDHRGRSSHGATVKGLKMLQESHRRGGIPVAPGVLCVIDPAFDGGEVYHHLVHELGVSGFDLLLPDVHVGEVDGAFTEGIGRFLKQAFKAWTDHDDPSVDIRVFTSQMRVLLGGRASFIGFAASVPDAAAFTISTAGTVHVDDTLRPTNHPIFRSIGHIGETGMAAVLASRQMAELSVLAESAPGACLDCTWFAACKGGALVNRFDPGSGFDHPSVLCPALKKLYAMCTAYLVSHGVEPRTIEDNLGLSETEDADLIGT